MGFRFTGDYSILYTQYFDEATDRPLLASPGNIYDMRPAGTWNVPVPPQDGRWEPVSEDEAPAPGVTPDAPAEAPQPPAVDSQPAPEPAAPAEPAPDVTGDDSPVQAA